LYEQDTREAEMAEWGLAPSDYPDDGAVSLWPENLHSVNAFIAMATQWRVGMAGATGFDYGVLPSVFRLLGIPHKEWADTFECLRVMESEAMNVMQEARA
jgi:hypothetical protein